MLCAYNTGLASYRNKCSSNRESTNCFTSYRYRYSRV